MIPKYVYNLEGNLARREYDLNFEFSQLIQHVMLETEITFWFLKWSPSIWYHVILLKWHFWADNDQNMHLFKLQLWTVLKYIHYVETFTFICNCLPLFSRLNAVGKI